MSNNGMRKCVSRLFLRVIALLAFAVTARIIYINIHYNKYTIMLMGDADSAFTIVSDFMDLRMGQAPAQKIKNKDYNEFSEQKHKLAGLSCDRYGGPAIGQEEMVYWQDVPSDEAYKSPFHDSNNERYLTFEPDHGGWNNIRMSMETVLAIAASTGRTLVLPPAQNMYLLSKKTTKGSEKLQKHQFGFEDFFHMDSIRDEHDGLDIITMQKFLERRIMTGKIKSKSNTMLQPPNNVTVWDGKSQQNMGKLFEWLRTESTQMLEWNPDKCFVAFPSSSQESDVQQLLDAKNETDKANVNWEDYIGKPQPIDSPMIDRMKEMLATRPDMCLYDHELQQAQWLHLPVTKELRLLVHFYALLFYQDWRHDLWIKRFVRDHVRYADEIQCAAARVVIAVREYARKYGSSDGAFDSIHVRRGDFQYKSTKISAEEMLKMLQRKIKPGRVLFVATDERNKSFFAPLTKVYKVVYLDNFVDVLQDVNTNYFGMIDQLVASRGRTFYGCWFSTFTGYINRLRGYYATNDKLPGYDQGIIDSWHYALEDRFDHMQMYYPVKRMFYAREFPTSWRLIDYSLDH